MASYKPGQLARLITGYLVGLVALPVVIGVWVVGFLYNWHFKWSGLPGNLMVSFYLRSSATIFMTVLIAGDSKQSQQIIY